MPQTRLKLIADVCLRSRDSRAVPAESAEGIDLKQRTSEAFYVSEDAACGALFAAWLM